MCGRFNITDHPGVYDLCLVLGVPAPAPNFNVAPGSQAQFITAKHPNQTDPQQDHSNQLNLGYWSFLMEPHPNNPNKLRPNPSYKTFNAQSRRLTSSPLWQQAYRQQRCIVPMSGFYEWNKGQCHYITPEHGKAFAMAGLYTQFTKGPQTAFAFSIITLPPQDEFCHIHDKSYPFALLPNEYEQWLDNSNYQPDTYQQWMDAGIRQGIQIEAVNKPFEPNQQQSLFTL